MNAHETYRERSDRVVYQLDKILALVTQADEVEAKTPEYWTNAGTLDHINEELGAIIRFMGGR